ncbi:MAG TPA: glutamate--tRNA ligase [Steroidobacteraceae bacterium]|nr:glutamate--tRNA ligase [Steroidobacteraceae bacterium]
MAPDIVTRFAPSPTGALHPGNARTALFNFLLARQCRGRFIVRVEDTDRERGSEAFVDAQLADLAWLGLEFDAGPGRDDGRGPYRQSERAGLYAGLFERLERDGRAYPCFCTPAELEVGRRTQIAAGEPPRYAGTCRELDAAARASHLAAGRKPALRFAVDGDAPVRFDDLVRGPQAVEPATIGDFIVRRADGGAVFFFCNAVDDALMGVTHVLRGDDHLSNTPRQVLLLAALDLPAPRYGHLPLLLDAGGSPQSKRRGSVTVAALRDRGYLQSALLNYMLRLGHHGAPDEWVEQGDLPGHFHALKLGRAPAHFDPVQLDHWQREAVRRLDDDGAARWLAAEFPADWPRDRRASVAALLKGNVLLPRDAREWLPVLSGNLPPMPAEAMRVIADAGPEFFDAALASYGEAGADLAAFAERLKARTGRKGKALFMPLRLALTGRHDGPELAALLAAMPQRLVRDRLESASRRRES